VGTSTRSKASSPFEVGEITLDKTKGNGLVHATGTVRNRTDRQHFGVRVDLDVLDGGGAKIGTATDYLRVLEPKAEWTFRALVLDSRVDSVKLRSVTEKE
jgi:hypothetical protein